MWRSSSRWGRSSTDSPAAALALAREGGHSTARVVHAGGAATGAEVERALVEATRSSAAAVLEGWFALDLLVEGGRCRGVRVMTTDGRVTEVRADHTVLATGGAGQLFAVTTNPAEATADGLAMALRAGVTVADVEFMQFHPTALHHPAMPRPLLSEALRGHGALLRDRRGERFVDELAPRDVVSRAMAERMREEGCENLWLDATGLDSFEERFPTIARSLAEAGLDPSVDWLPIAPAAHYLSGGVLTDLNGATVLPGLWAAGEVACTGVHGANRLASNSLLEGMVFGARSGRVHLAGVDGPVCQRRPCRPRPVRLLVAARRHDGRTRCRTATERWSRAPRRDGQGPRPVAAGDDRGCGRRAHGRVVGLGRRPRWRGWPSCSDPPRRTGISGELANLITVARAVLSAATWREETRGAHARADHPVAVGVVAATDHPPGRRTNVGDRTAGPALDPRHPGIGGALSCRHRHEQTSPGPWPGLSPKTSVPSATSPPPFCRPEPR